MKMEVRCCCVPEKLLGWLEVPEGISGDRRFLVEHDPMVSDWAKRTIAPQVITLPIAEVEHPDGRRYKAFKSEETPLEVLRRIPGFVENK